jgi:hypothetical protein
VGYNEYEKTVYFVDMNGDGLADWVYQGAVYLNTGSGWEASPTWPTLPSGTTDFNKKFRLGDVNGDGLPDLLGHESVLSSQGVSYSKAAYFNNGDGTWTEDNDFKNSLPEGIPFYGTNHTNGDEYFYNRYLVDVNGDGLSDLLADTTAYLNTGTSWSTTTTLTLPTDADNLVKGYRLIDIDADGSEDFLRSDIESYLAVPIIYTYKNAYLSDATPLWLLSTTTNEFGGVTTIEYTPSTEQVTGSLPSPKLPFVKQLVSKITTDPLFGSEQATEFIHRAGSFYFASTSPFDRKFAGFGQVTKTTDQSKKITYYHQGNGATSTSAENIDDEALIGRAYRTEVRDLSIICTSSRGTTTPPHRSAMTAALCSSKAK